MPINWNEKQLDVDEIACLEGSSVKAIRPQDVIGGELHVKVVRAQNLRNADQTFMQKCFPFFGPSRSNNRKTVEDVSDPFVRVRMLNAKPWNPDLKDDSVDLSKEEWKKIVQKSAVIQNDCNPEWNETMEFILDWSDDWDKRPEIVRLDIFDDDNDWQYGLAPDTFGDGEKSCDALGAVEFIMKNDIIDKLPYENVDLACYESEEMTYDLKDYTKGKLLGDYNKLSTSGSGASLTVKIKFLPRYPVKKEETTGV